MSFREIRNSKTCYKTWGRHKRETEEPLQIHKSGKPSRRFELGERLGHLIYSTRHCGLGEAECGAPPFGHTIFQVAALGWLAMAG